MADRSAPCSSRELFRNQREIDTLRGNVLCSLTVNERRLFEVYLRDFTVHVWSTLPGVIFVTAEGETWCRPRVLHT